MGICGRPRSGCGPSTNHGSRPDASGPRTAPRGGWRGPSGALAAGPNGPSSASSAARTVPRPRQPRRGWSGPSEEGAGEDSVAPGFAHDLVRVLRAHRQRDPELSELRGRLVRDQITDAYLTRELPGGQPLDPAALAAEVGTSTTVARQWLHTLRAGSQSDRRLARLRAEPTSHGRPTSDQLQGLQATYASGGRPSRNDDSRPAERALEQIEQRYQT